MRRARLAALLGDGVAVVPAAPVADATAARYRPAPDMLYLTGMAEPDAALVIVAARGRIRREVLLCRPRDPVRERWDGPIIGPRRAARLLGIDETAAIAKLDETIAGALPDCPRLFVCLGGHPQLARRLLGALKSTRTGQSASLNDLRPLVNRLRVVKSKAEIAAIRRSCALTTRAIKAAIKAVPRARTEAQILAVLEATYTAAGARTSFTPIVACGANACVAHYNECASRLAAGRLLLIDTGCELDGYAADITRVAPVDGRFSPAQKALYQVVLKAQQAAIAAIRPRSTMAAAQLAASLELARGLVRLGVCHGRARTVVASARFRRLYFHSIGHMVGLDVHDPYNPESRPGQPLPLEEDMVVTVEPGLYLDSDRSIPAPLRNTGIRIEDIVAVRKRRADVLTAAMPREVAAVERLASA